MPALLRRVGEQTAELRAVAAALARRTSGAPAVEETEELALCAGLEELLRRLPEESRLEDAEGEAPGVLERSGWCLAALASLAGTDLLLGRRERWGPLALTELALEAARWPATAVGSGSRADTRAASDLAAWCPRLRASTQGRGYELAALVAGLVGARARTAAPPRVELLESGGALVRIAGPAEPEAVVPEPPDAAAATLIPGARLGTASDGVALHLPAGWLAVPGKLGQ